MNPLTAACAVVFLFLVLVALAPWIMLLGEMADRNGKDGEQ